MQKKIITGCLQIMIDSDAEADAEELIDKLETMDKIKPGDIAAGAVPVKDLFSGDIVGFIR